MTAELTLPDPLLPLRTVGQFYLAQVFSCSVSPSLPPLWQRKSSSLGICGDTDTQGQPGAGLGSPFFGVSSIRVRVQRDIPDPLMAWKNQGFLRLLHPSLVGMTLLGWRQKRAWEDQNTSHSSTSPFGAPLPITSSSSWSTKNCQRSEKCSLFME